MVFVYTFEVAPRISENPPMQEWPMACRQIGNWDQCVAVIGISSRSCGVCKGVAKKFSSSTPFEGISLETSGIKKYSAKARYPSRSHFLPQVRPVPSAQPIHLDGGSLAGDDFEVGRRTGGASGGVENRRHHIQTVGR